ILWQILDRLECVHNKHLIHRDIHSGNILFVETNHPSYVLQIGDFGLSQPANDNSQNNVIYGVIPYIASEIFIDSSFSKETDIYSISMIIWELTTGCKPFANVEHDYKLIYEIIDRTQPEITEDTPECYANLMKRCWDSNTSNRPSIKEICRTVGDWYISGKNKKEFKQAENQRLELIKLRKIGPELSEKHLNAIYTSRAFSRSSINSLVKSLNIKQEYISIEQEDDTQCLSLAKINCKTQDPDADYGNISFNEYISKELGFDIPCQPEKNVNFTTQGATSP
ncbi:2677_t:CDS:2, partial [Funneliformis geosporum]